MSGGAASTVLLMLIGGACWACASALAAGAHNSLALCLLLLVAVVAMGWVGTSWCYAHAVATSDGELVVASGAFVLGCRRLAKPFPGAMHESQVIIVDYALSIASNRAG